MQVLPAFASNWVVIDTRDAQLNKPKSHLRNSLSVPVRSHLHCTVLAERHSPLPASLCSPTLTIWLNGGSYSSAQCWGLCRWASEKETGSEGQRQLRAALLLPQAWFLLVSLDTEAAFTTASESPSCFPLTHFLPPRSPPSSKRRPNRGALG